MEEKEIRQELLRLRQQLQRLQRQLSRGALNTQVKQPLNYKDDMLLCGQEQKSRIFNLLGRFNGKAGEDRICGLQFQSRGRQIILFLCPEGLSAAWHKAALG
jgi:hypothetical protein